MLLAKVKHGTQVRILSYEGGEGVERKLRQLGLNPGEVVYVRRQAPFGGPILVEVTGRTIAVGRGIAARINVEKEIPECD
jgi:Fe2+ transport system protein FeoA